MTPAEKVGMTLPKLNEILFDIFSEPVFQGQGTLKRQSGQYAISVEKMLISVCNFMQVFYNLK